MKRGTRRAVAAVSAVALAAGCTALPDDVADSTSDVVSGTPDERQIAGTLTRAVTMTSDMGGTDAYCTVPAGAITVAEFKSGRFRIYLPGNHPCVAAKPDSYRGWVPGDAIAIDDSAYGTELTRVDASAAIDLQMNYAGDKIFCTNGTCLIHAPLYGMGRCYVHPQMFTKVNAAAAAVNAKVPGGKLAFFDCYRPIYVQYEMAALVNDPTWVAQPAPPRYGDHNGGVAIDVTLEDATGNLLDMGSGFDEFSDRSKYAASGLTPVEVANRKLLRDLMTSVGLAPYDNEWWHFSISAIQAKPLDLAL